MLSMWHAGISCHSSAADLSIVNERFVAVDGTTKNRNFEAGFELGPVRFYTTSSYVPVFASQAPLSHY